MVWLANPENSDVSVSDWFGWLIIKTVMDQKVSVWLADDANSDASELAGAESVWLTEKVICLAG